MKVEKEKFLVIFMLRIKNEKKISKLGFKNIAKEKKENKNYYDNLTFIFRKFSYIGIFIFGLKS